MSTHTGSCVCGAVRYEATFELDGKATRCNCRLCTKYGLTGAHLPPADFRVLEGEAQLATWARAPQVARRFFCRTCGTQLFSRGYEAVFGKPTVSLAVNTLDDVDVGQLTIGYFNGRHDNWHAGTRAQPWPV